MQQRRFKRKFETSNDFQVRRKGQTWSETNDFDLLTKIGDSDIVTMEKKFHSHYLCDFYKRKNITKNQVQMENDNDKSVFVGLFCQK